MIIGFTGHRNVNCPQSELDNLAQSYPGRTWVQGGAVGFDTQVLEYAKAHGIDWITFLPEYDMYDKREAPLRRNDDIVKVSDILVACYDGRRRGGTLYTINRAKEKGIEIVYVTPVPIEGDLE